MNRQEHLQWCKNRAFEYLDVDDKVNAISSFLSDMSKHEETAGHIALPLLMIEVMSGTNQSIRNTIDGFN